MDVSQLSDIDVQAIQLPVLQENRWLQVIVVIYNLLAVAYASALLLTFYDYEKFGGDPQKRGIINQVG